MNAQQYRAAIAKLGLSQEGAGRFLGITGRTSRNYIAGKTTVQPAIAILLNLMVGMKVTPGEAAAFSDRGGGAPATPRGRRKPRRRPARRQATTRARRKSPFAPGPA